MESKLKGNSKRPLPCSFPEASCTLFQPSILPHRCLEREEGREGGREGEKTINQYLGGKIIRGALTSRICLTRVSDAFSEMFPTNTVVATFMELGDMTGTLGGKEEEGRKGGMCRDAGRGREGGEACKVRE